jgi:hypothetical protein
MTMTMAIDYVLIASVPSSSFFPFHFSFFPCHSLDLSRASPSATVKHYLFITIHDAIPPYISQQDNKHGPAQCIFKQRTRQSVRTSTLAQLEPLLAADPAAPPDPPYRPTKITASIAGAYSTIYGRTACHDASRHATPPHALCTTL